MEQAVINVRVDRADKQQFDEFCNAVGMNISVAVNMFIKNVIKLQKLPFQVANYSIQDHDLTEAIAESEKLLHDPKAPVYHSIDELRAALDL